MNLLSHTATLSALLLAMFQPGCALPEVVLDSPSPPITRAEVDLERYTRKAIGKKPEGVPWVAHVRAFDLNQDGYISKSEINELKNLIDSLK